MPYVNEGIDQRAEVLQGTANDSLVYWPKLDGANVVPSSAFVTLYEPGGGEKAARAAVAPGANGQLVRAQAWPIATYQLQEDYFALWEFTVAGVDYADRQYFDVVKNKLICSVSEHDLADVYPNLNAHLAAVGETVPVKFIRRAWSELLDRIRAGGNRPSLVLDKARLHNPALRLAVSYACDALSMEVGDLWDRRRETNEKLFETYFNGLGALKYDHDQDALASSTDVQSVAHRDWSV